MADAKINFEPVYVAASAGNLFNVNVTALTGPVGFTLGQPRATINRITLTNTDTASHTVSLYKGATAGSTGGTQYFAAGLVIPANSAIFFYPAGDIFDSADFLTGICDTASKVVFTLSGTIALKSA